MDDGSPPLQAESDEALVLRARSGDRTAFGELWARHSKSGLRVARQFTTSINADADDLVAEAYTRIYQRVLAGGGPDGAFRPYLYTTIRHLAGRIGQSRREVNVEDIGDFEDPAAESDPISSALDRSLTVIAFRALPVRWQSVLWYTEVEGMDAHEVAPILGITANSVAALSYRAREGLRKAWLQAHIAQGDGLGTVTSIECKWAITRLGDYARNGLTLRERTRVAGHLATCEKCLLISEEVDEVGSRLAFVMLPLLLGGVVGGSLLASFGSSGSAMAASAVSSTAATSGVATTGAATSAASASGASASGALGSVGAASAGLAATSVTAPFVGVLAVALVISGGLAVSADTSTAPSTSTSTVSASTEAARLAEAAWVTPDSGSAADRSATGPLLNPPVDPSGLGALSADPSAANAVGGVDALGQVISPLTGPVGSAVNGAVSGAGSALDGIVSGVTAPINSLIPGAAVGPGQPPVATAPGGVVGANAALDLTGSGIPGATVSLQAAGVVYATTKVTPGGTWAIHVEALPKSVTGLQLKQTVLSLLGIDLSTPLRVLSNSLGITIGILGL
jgi:RNA polymerase sigma factor (sigma-70 family)